MSRQFVLIDHSIEDAAGHHLEYARRVLGAAKANGFRTVLAVNRRARPLECPEADAIFKPFSRTCWEIQAQPAVRTVVGFLLRRDAMAAESLHVTTFAAELGSLIVESEISEADIVFVPTLGGPEALAISIYSGTKAAVAVQWHLLFRRDVALRPSLGALRDRIARWRIQSMMILAAQGFNAGVRYLYTDTEELSQRYDSLGVGRFETLPIPLDERLRLKRSRCADSPLVVSYVGDMREEKGIHHLPRIIRTLRREGIDPSKVLFRIQSNLPNGRVKASALKIRATLKNMAVDGVEMVGGPLTSAEYHELLKSSDVILIPYSETSYEARSSGIFAEARAAGIPTIHPVNTWMEKNSVTAGYKGFTDMINVIKSTIKSYAEHEKNSMSAAGHWQRRHSAQELINAMRRNEEK